MKTLKDIGELAAAIGRLDAHQSRAILGETHLGPPAFKRVDTYDFAFGTSCPVRLGDF